MEIAVGTPPRRFLVILDTGSCEFWLPESNCDTWPCYLKKKYDPNLSSTYRGPFGDFVQSYLDSSIQGKIVQDDVQIGRLKINDLRFAAAAELNGPSLVGRTFDGLMGLCPRRSRYNHDNFIETLYLDGLISHPVFSIWLGPGLRDGGKLSVGRIAEEYADSKIVWFSTGPRNKWSTRLDSFQVGNVEFVRRASAFILDSGTTMIIIPEAAARAIYEQIGAVLDRKERMMRVNCRHVHTFPSIKMNLEDRYDIILHPEQYIISKQSGCFSAFEGRDIIRGGLQYWVMGGPFLRSHFTAYNLRDREFGIAVAITDKLKGATCPIL